MGIELVPRTSQGKANFSPEEIARIIGDPVKIAEGLRKFSRRMREENYDPHPGTLILKKNRFTLSVNFPLAS